MKCGKTKKRLCVRIDDENKPDAEVGEEDKDSAKKNCQSGRVRGTLCRRLIFDCPFVG